VETRDHFINGAKLKSHTSRTIKNNKMEEKKKSRVPIVVLVFVFVGCLLIGAGIGNAFDAMDVGGTIGIGVGFIGMGIIWMYFRNK
jgi:F0F1-type ATP synthase assembly protein I